MTSPTVGQVQVEVIASVSKLAKTLREQLQSSFKGLDLGKAIQDSIGNTKLRLPKVPVDLDPNTESITEKVRKTRVPKVPVELDPVLQAFQQEIRRQTAALGRSLNVNVPVGADTAGLRAELGAQLAAVKAQSRIQVPTEPAGKAEYEAKLKAQLAEVAARVDQHVKVKVDVDKSALSSGGGGGLSGGIGDLFKGLFSVTPSISGLISGIGDLGGALQKVGTTGAEAGASVAGSFSSVAGPIGIAIGLGAAMAASIGTATIAALALGPAIGLVSAAFATAAGAAAALPAALAGAGAVVGTLGLGFKGIQEAFKPKVGGGGGGGGEDAASRARRIAAAERGVESARRGIAGATRGLAAAERSYQDAQLRLSAAQKNVTAAQDALNKARKEAAADIDDLGRALRGAQLDEESATLGVTEALRALNAAKETGNLPDIQRADLAYRQAQLTLENAKDATKDLGQESEDSAKKGVEGSDKVQSALANQADAYRAVKDAQNGVISAQDGLLSAQDAIKSSTDGLKSAQDSLAEAQKKSGASAAAAAAKLIPLAPAAQRFVDAVKALKPAFENLRLDVQQRLFEGLDKTVTNLGNAWIPALKVTLGSYADTFNGFFKNLGTSITTPKFIDDIQKGAEAARAGLSKIGDAITTSLVPAFGTLSSAAGPFLTQLGTEIANVVTKFGEWIDKADKSGALKSFFARATVAMHDLFDTGTLVAKIIGDIVGLIIGSDGSKKGQQTELEKFNGQLVKLHEFLKDPTTQAKIQDFITNIKDIAANFISAGNAASTLLSKFKSIRTLLFGNGPQQAAQADQNAINMGGTPLASDDTKTKAYTLGQDIGAALVLGIITGIDGANTLMGDFIASRLWDGPSSLIGIIKKGFGIASPSTVMADVGKNLVEGLKKGIDENSPSLRTRAQGIKDTVTGALSDAGSWLKTHGQSAMDGLGRGISSMGKWLSSVTGQARTWVRNALSDSGNWLYDHGGNAIKGLWNGIAAWGGWLWAKVANFVQDNVVNPVKNFLKISSPSKLMMEMGGHIATGLALGIEDRADVVKDAAATLAAAAKPDLGAMSFADLGSAGDLAISKSLTAAATSKIDVGWVQGMTGDQILDALRGKIAFSYRGDPMAALGSG